MEIRPSFGLAGDFAVCFFIAVGVNHLRVDQRFKRVLYQFVTRGGGAQSDIGFAILRLAVHPVLAAFAAVPVLGEVNFERA